MPQKKHDQGGTRLRLARRTCGAPERGGYLSQERFAELVSLHGTRAGFPTPGTVSNWECGRSQPSHHDREALCAILAVLLKYGGLANEDELNSIRSSPTPSRSCTANRRAARAAPGGRSCLLWHRAYSLILPSGILDLKSQLILFDFDRHRRTWDQLQRQSESPQLRVSGLPPRVRPGVGDVVVRVSAAGTGMPTIS